MNTKDIGKDAWKYQKIYDKDGVLSKGGIQDKIEGTFEEYTKLGLGGKWKKYGHAFEGRDHIQEVVALKPSSILDIGCGHNEFCHAVRKILKIKCIGADIACSGADIVSPSHNMPTISDKEFDLITSFDCIEHIPEEEVDRSFKEFSRVGKRIFVKICLEDSSTKIDGSPVHICIKPKEWWISVAEKYFTLERAEVQGTSRFDPKEQRVIYNFPGDRARSLLLYGECRND